MTTTSLMQAHALAWLYRFYCQLKNSYSDYSPSNLARDGAFKSLQNPFLLVSKPIKVHVALSAAQNNALEKTICELLSNSG
ncbi:MAG: hypothetical protein IMY79_02995 [Chloroflexi bacterium]|nr:hypothetical protein [Chloroflexota bacterium]